MAKRLLPFPFVLAIALLITPLAQAQTAPLTGVLSGDVFYRQRVALPDDAVVEVSLQDVSLVGAPAKIIAQEKIAAAGKQVPIPFRLEYRTADLRSSHRYQLRARITLNGELLFTSTRSYPVLADPQAPGNIQIMVDQVQARPGAAHVPLEETDWRLTELNGEPLAVQSNFQQAHILLHAAGRTFAGNGGCNRLTGSYVASGETLRFKMVASTMMACPGPVMKQEQSLNKALANTVRFRIVGATLELFDNRQMVAKFEAGSAK
jgi:putative lipoprotein